MSWNLRRTPPTLVALILVVTGWLALPAVSRAQNKEPLRIPMMESFSGAAASWGADMFTGAVVAAEMINKEGGIKARPVDFYKADAPYDDVPSAVTMLCKLARDPSLASICDGGATTVIVAVHDRGEECEAPLRAFSS